MLGYTVLRFWNIEVISEIDAVLQTIWNNCIPRPLPQPSPFGEGVLISDFK
jgi:very-short-patch-repair endonuclease